MYIWDVPRLLARRWPVSVPLLLLTGVATVVAAFNIRPDYAGTAHVSLLQPTVQHTAAAGQAVRVNPWDPETLAGAVVVRLNSKSFAGQAEAEGFQRAWRASLEGTTRSVVRIEVTSPTSAQARSALTRLLREADDEVDRQQARYPKLAPEEKITTIRLGADDVEKATGNVKRATAVVAVLGLVVTIAVCAGVDAAARRRGRGRSAIPGAPGGTSIDTDATQPVVITNVPLHVPVAGAMPATLPTVRYLSSEEPRSTGRSASSPDDSTIVLPFSNVPWADRPKSITAGNGTPDGSSETTARS
jgi:hypothetical protein